MVEEAGGEQGKVETLASAPSIEVAIAADTARFESEFLTALNDGKEISVQVPEPDLTVHFDGEACAFDGPTAYRADGATTRIVVELINDTEGVISLATGLHEGATWEQLREDAAAVQAERAQPPAYWELTGSITMQGQAMTGGRSLAPLDLPVGTHALVCGTEDGRLFLLTDLEVGSEG